MFYKYFIDCFSLESESVKKLNDSVKWYAVWWFEVESSQGLLWMKCTWYLQLGLWQYILF